MARTINEYLRLLLDRVPVLSGGRIPVDTGVGGTAHSIYNEILFTGSAVVIKAGAGNIYRALIFNPNATPVYFKIANATSATPGVTVPQTRLVVPPASGSNPGFVSADLSGQAYEAYTTGITAWAVTGNADSSSTLPASALTVEIRYI